MHSRMGGTVTIIKQTGNTVSLYISDNGIGMKLDPGEEYETGIGLVLFAFGQIGQL